MGWVYCGFVCCFAFASASAISSQDGARHACHGGPARITSPSALHLAVPGLEPAPLKVSSSCLVPTSRTLTASRPPDVEISRRPCLRAWSCRALAARLRFQNAAGISVNPVQIFDTLAQLIVASAGAFKKGALEFLHFCQAKGLREASPG